MYANQLSERLFFKGLMQHLFVAGMVSAMREAAVSVLFFVDKISLLRSVRIQQDACLSREKKAMASASACCLSSYGRSARAKLLKKSKVSSRGEVEMGVESFIGMTG